MRGLYRDAGITADVVLAVIGIAAKAAFPLLSTISVEENNPIGTPLARSEIQFVGLPTHRTRLSIAHMTDGKSAISRAFGNQALITPAIALTGPYSDDTPPRTIFNMINLLEWNFIERSAGFTQRNPFHRAAPDYR